MLLMSESGFAKTIRTAAICDTQTKNRKEAEMYKISRPGVKEVMTFDYALCYTRVLKIENQRPTSNNNNILLDNEMGFSLSNFRNNFRFFCVPYFVMHPRFPTVTKKIFSSFFVVFLLICGNLHFFLCHKR